MGGVAIHVNGEPKGEVHTGGYYPFIISPGTVSLGYSVIVHPMVGVRLKKERMLEFWAEAGQTYYVAYRPWSGTWYPQLVLVPAEQAHPKVATYTLGRDFKP